MNTQKKKEFYRVCLMHAWLGFVGWKFCPSLRWNQLYAIECVKTRVCQYQALENGKGIEIAKQIVKAKIEGQNRVLKKYGLKPFDSNVENVRNKKRLLIIESRHARLYFSQIRKLFPKSIRPEKRKTYKAYDGINNVFNFGYYVLKCRVHKALLKAKLEPYLGFLHSLQHGKPSLVCDFQDLYRYLIDDFLIERCRKLRKNDFVVVTDFIMRLKMGKRIISANMKQIL